MRAAHEVTPVQYRQVLKESLQAIKDYYDFEHRKQEEWFEVEDRDMAAYHRGQMRGLRLAQQMLETKLAQAEAGLAASDAATAQFEFSRN